VKNDFFKFPSTPHLVTLSDGVIRDDKVMSESERNHFLQYELTVEEKVDGANLGISFDQEGNIRAQNRGAYLHFPSSGQWKKLGEWLAPRTDILFENLSNRYIFFGEWCYAQHSVFYDRLPDWCLGFDIYDKQVGRFLSSNRRDEFFKRMKIISVPKIAYGRFTLANLTKLLSQSELSSQPAEGIYLRFDKDDWLELRAKLVRSAFIQSMEQHWTHFVIKPNRLNL
jgi:ATP-dependent RNA circularization protein (DNA/RNA ligase family)